MSEYRYVCCDKCNPQGNPYRPGTYIGRAKFVKDFGWRVKRDGSGCEKHVCQNCLELEENDSAQ